MTHLLGKTEEDGRQTQHMGGFEDRLCCSIQYGLIPGEKEETRGETIGRANPRPWNLEGASDSKQAWSENSYERKSEKKTIETQENDWQGEERTKHALPYWKTTKNGPEYLITGDRRIRKKIWVKVQANS